MELRISIEPQDGATYEQELAVALAAERLGFAAFFRSDHLLAMTGDGLPGPTDAWTTLAALARQTTTIRLGTLMTNASFRQPAVLAVTAAQIDRMSGGRLELGLGAGWFQAEYEALGIPFLTTVERLNVLDEQLEILSGLWTTPEGGRYAFAGAHYTIAENPALPRPAQPGGPPLIVGGVGPRRTPAAAARWAAEFNSPFGPPSVAAERFARVRAACDDAGRDPATLLLSHFTAVCCGRDRREIAERIERSGMSEAEVRERGVFGTPAEVVERLRAYASAGADRFYIQMTNLTDIDHLELIAADVMPHV